MNIFPSPETFPLTHAQRRSFVDQPKACRVSGPRGLVRLVTRGAPKAGAFSGH